MVHSLIGAIHIKEREPASTSSANGSRSLFLHHLLFQFLQQFGILQDGDAGKIMGSVLLIIRNN